MVKWARLLTERRWILTRMVGGEHVVALVAVSNVPFTLMKFLRTGFLLMVNPCKIHIFLSRKKETKRALTK
jgi:hypothetical protein